MLTSELTEYLVSIKRMNPPPSEADLRTALNSAGWNEADIREAIAFIRGPKPVSPPPVERQPLREALPTGIDLKKKEIEPAREPITMKQMSSDVVPVSKSWVPVGVSPDKNSGLEIKVTEPTFGSMRTTRELSPLENSLPQQLPREPVQQSHIDDAFSLKMVSPDRAPDAPVQDSFQPEPRVAPPTTTFRPTNAGRNVFGSDVSPQPTILSMKPNGTLVSPSPRSSSTGRSIGKLVMLIAIIVMVMGGGGFAAFAYYKGWITLPSFLSGKMGGVAMYEESQFLTKLFGSVKGIRTASYEISVASKIEPREANAVPFSLAVPEADKELLLAYKRDQDRFRALTDLTNALNTYWATNKNVYPSSLSMLSITPKDPSGTDFVYALTDAGKGYALTITFETSDAIAAITDMDRLTVPRIGLPAPSAEPKPVIKEKTVTFSQGGSAYYSFSGKPSQPSFSELVGQADMLMNYIPPDFSGSIAVSGTAYLGAERTKDDGLNVRGVVKYNTANWNIGVDVELINIGGAFGDYYVRLNEFPTSIPFVGTMFSTLVGNWIKLDPEELGSSYLGMGGLSGSQDKYEEAKDKVFVAFQDILKMADEEKVIEFVRPPVREELAGIGTYRYDIFFKQASILPFLKRVDAAYGDVELASGEPNPYQLTQETIDLLEGDEFAQVFAYLKENIKVSVWIDASTGNPLKFDIVTRTVPGEKVTRLADKQLTTAVTLAFSNVNQPIAVKAPESFMTQEDATIKVTGESKESYRLKKQMNNIQMLKRALADFKIYTGNYPETLSDLTRKGSDFSVQRIIPQDEQFNYKFIEMQYKDKPFLTAVPVDVESGEPYDYRVAGDDYALSFTLTLPEYKAGTNPQKYYLTDRTTVAGKTKYVLRYVTGKNTATSKSDSTEAVEAGKADTDADLVSDTLEAFIASDPKKKDSDADGYSDADELTRGTNPTGPGNLEYEGSSFFF